ncbi:nitrous oxide-stimulated promoter family protein [Arcobacter porcinus]|uniref:Nitrous oxide-regulated protein n=1 Tax=Arcobacter porcinus TaxID=1935204 RepID=A0ABX2YG82_9BACT|nr:nitrous oxide-stimulated promoter family protein [Arcobacter porcinus]OCL84319.1 hypothetical protein AAW30_00693 [Arcobacter porcinus]OCL89376.1 hypothetical protein AAX30_00514 [Arcobacter porcinus]OCL91795.1 hypothetical protein AAX28_01541 [Arcobacter porcinus]
MTFEKFNEEISTLKKFYELYCKDKHEKQAIYQKNIFYKEHNFRLDLNLCEDCLKNISYSFSKLQSCPHEIKPRCRSCTAPCYEKLEWKTCAKVMKYSSIKLSLGKIKSRVINIFN